MPIKESLWYQISKQEEVLYTCFEPISDIYVNFWYFKNAKRWVSYGGWMCLEIEGEVTFCLENGNTYRTEYYRDLGDTLQWFNGNTSFDLTITTWKDVPNAARDEFVKRKNLLLSKEKPIP